jgi:hypothetical protein
MSFMISAIFGISTLKHVSVEDDVDLDSIFEGMSPDPSQAPKRWTARLLRHISRWPFIPRLPGPRVPAE